MSYTVIARRWRPQKLEEVVGQRAVTQTLRNAIATNRVAQAFVFSGPRGVGKTTTARILARMLNCEQGPTPDPCVLPDPAHPKADLPAACDACREIAEGRDMDVLEIDAATNTQVDKVREVIIAGLGMLPARDRYKIFIIDEVHQLSAHSFNALLKSIEEPPPHVAFIMATTAADKIPDTIVSRSQVFEFKTISSRLIADQLAKIAKADGIDASPEAIGLVARSAEGSMRDAETAFDQVIAFAGNKVTVEDVATVLGLVGRDLLFDVLTAVADENGAAAFELAGRAVEAGHDLKLLCRELSRLVRDLLVLLVDPRRFDDRDVAPEGDHERLRALLERFSREDLLRSFDVLARAEYEIRGAAEPRYNFEMALLQWIHLRKLTPLADLIDRLEGVAPPPAGSAPRAAAGSGMLPLSPARPAPSSSASVARRFSTAPPRQPSAGPVSRLAGAPAVPPAGPPAAPQGSAAPPPARSPAPPLDDDPSVDPPAASPSAGGSFKDAFLAAIQKQRPMLYGTIVAQARRIEIEGDRIAFRFGPVQTILGDGVTREKAWLEALASEIAGRRMSVGADVAKGETAPAPLKAGGRPPAPEQVRDLRAEAMTDPVLQSLLDVIPAEVKEITELNDP